jgi:predicted nucleic-acid-binding Zn-ribbon protein
MRARLKYRQRPSAEVLLSRRTAMKNSKKCPKCECADILRIPGKVGAYGSGNNISIGRIVFRGVPVTRYLCTSCGFSEEWVDSAEDIAKLTQKYA